MAVTDNFSASVLDLNGFNLNSPSALVWGSDGRLYVTEVTGDVHVMTVEFGDSPSDANPEAKFFVTDMTTISDVKNIPNFNDDGTPNPGTTRQVTGIDVTNQYDDSGNRLYIDTNGQLTTTPTDTPAVTMYVTSTDQRIGAGTGGGDVNLDTNSGVITKLVQTGPDSWEPIDIVRGLARSEENHALNGLEIIQEVDANGVLISERLLVANGGNANTGAPSNNFAGQQEQPYSAAILEVDLDAINAMDILTDASSGRSYVYDMPTLDDPTRDGENDNNDPQGGNDGLNSAKIEADSPVQIYSPGYRNSYDVEVTEDGRVWTYDNGANNSWGGRPIGEAGENGAVDLAQALNYISTNLNNGDGDADDDINLVNWNPSNKDNFHEVTRSDDLDGRDLSQGNTGPVTYESNGLTYVYGGHPNPTRAEGALAGLLFSPGNGTDDAFLLISNKASYDDTEGAPTDYDQVIAFLESLENNDALYPTTGVYGADAGELTSRVLAVEPGIEYNIYKLEDGTGVALPVGEDAPANSTLLGQSGLPADIADIVAEPNKIEGDYKEAGKYDGAVDTGNGSVNGLAEYTSTILDEGNIDMSGAILTTDYNGELIIIGREADGTVGTTTNGQGFTVAADREVISLGGGNPLGIATLGDQYFNQGLSQPFQGSIWIAKLGQNSIQILQPANGAVPLAGQEIVDPTDNDFDGVDNIHDPFEYSSSNGYDIAPGQKLSLEFEALSTDFPGTLSNTGLLGAALDGETPNKDATTIADGAEPGAVVDGLFDNGGNIIPGANAPRLQIKAVVPGSVVGSENDARDVLHTGIKPSSDTDRVEAVFNIKNWVPSVDGGLQPGQLVGMMFGDGTQANFVRFVFGSVGGVPGFEVGIETGDSGYQVLGTAAVPSLTSSSIGTVELKFEVNINTFEIETSYHLEGDAGFTSIPLSNSTLPVGVLRDVLTGNHTITDGDGPVLSSGAAIGVLAETSEGNPLEAIDFNSIEIEAFGNELYATNADEVDQNGSAGTDTLIYTGTDTDLDPMAANVERFDGTGSSADFTVEANDLDNLIRVGSGNNTVITREGADSVRGTLEDLGGDEITDFSFQDEVIIEGETLNTIGTPTFGGSAGSAEITIGGQTITLTGPDLADYDPADGAASISITQASDGVRIAVEPALAPVIAINAGGPAVTGVTMRDMVIDFKSNTSGGQGDGYTSTGDFKTHSNASSNSHDFPNTELDAIHAVERSSAPAAKWGYSIPVENGTYLVDLLFAEIYHGLHTSSDPDNMRVFDIFVEDQLVEDNYDIIDDAGGAGIEVIKTYEVVVTDGQLNVEFSLEVDQAKLSGLAVWKLGGTYTPPADETAPEIVSITVENEQSIQDGERTATVVLSDETGFDADDFTGLDGDELQFTGIVPDTISAPDVDISADGKTATLIYTLSRDDNAWPNGEGQISIAAGAYSDAADNTTEAASAAFILEANLAALVRGNVVRAINVGTTDTTAGTLGADPIDGITDNNRYGAAITGDTLITDAAGNPIDFEADNNDWYTGAKTNAQLNSNVDGQFPTSNSGGVDLDGSAYHTYRDSGSNTWTATYSGFANGSYVVELHFAELYHSSANARVGDFYVQGDLVLNDFDVFAEAGGADKPISRTHNVLVTDGTITVTVDSSQGEAGYSAIAVYEAVPSDLPATISVADATAVEGGDATVTFTRIGDLTEAVTVDYQINPGSADASDISAALTGSVVIPANSGSVTLPIAITDDSDEEPAEIFTVSITGVSGDAVIADATGTVTIGASDSDLQIPAGGTILELDFETNGDPLTEGGFDGVLGGSGALDAAVQTTVSGGKLIVETSNGDLSEAPQTASKNDFVKSVDLTDQALTEIYLTTRFDNPFTADVLAANGVTNGVIPNYAQQGILISTTAANAQDEDQFVKTVFGGNGGNAIQMWSQGEIDQKILISDISAAAAAPFGLADIASVEMSLAVDRSAASPTVAQIVTFFDAQGAILGGVRPEATPGFLTAPALAMPADVVAALNGGTSVVGVTSTDYQDLGSFEASWDFLSVTSPQQAADPGDTAFGTAFGDLSDDRLDPTDGGTLSLGDNLLTATQQGPGIEEERDRDYITFTVPTGHVLSAIELDGYETTEIAPFGFLGLQEGTALTVDPVTGQPDPDGTPLLGGLVYSPGEIGDNILPDIGAFTQEGVPITGFTGPLGEGTYTLWLNQGGNPTTASFNFIVTEAPVADITLSISDAPTLVEAGDINDTTLEFAVTASDAGFNGDVDVTFNATGAPGQTQTLTFVNGAATLTIDVANDDDDNGDDTIDVTLTGGSNAASDTFLISATNGTASGTVTEDDTDAPTLIRGDMVLAYNAGGGNVEGDGVTFVGASNGGGVFAGGTDFEDNNGGNKHQPLFDGTVYETEVNDNGDGNFTFSSDDLDPSKSYFVDLYFAEIYASDPGVRIFNVSAEDGAEPVLANFDVLAANGGDINAPVIIELSDPISPGANGKIDLSFDVALDGEGEPYDRAKVSAIVIREAVEPVVETAAVSVADASFDEETGLGTVEFTRTGPTDEAITVSYSLTDVSATSGDDYTAPSGTVVIAAGETTATVDITLNNDELDEGAETFTVTITGATDANGAVDFSATPATVTITDGDAAPLPVGFAPGDDLDQDGVANSEDDDIDGDTLLNGDETFVYDATNAGTALTAGQTVRLEFDTDGTPFENGLTGALVSNKPEVEEIKLADASVSGGKLNITATSGDHHNNANGQQNALVAAYSAAEGLRVTTRFDMPDFISTTAELDAPTNFQSAGVVIGTDQDNLMKIVFGRTGFEFELAQDNVGGNAAVAAPVYLESFGNADAASVEVTLEAYIEDDNGTPVPMFRALGTLFNANDEAISETAPLLSNGLEILGTLGAAILAGDPVGAGVIQTSTPTGNSRDTFSVSYDFLEVQSLGTPPANEAPTVDQAIGAQTTDEDAAFSFAVPADAFADDADLAELTLTATLADGSELPAWLSFTGTTFTGTPLDADVGTISVRVTATDQGGLSVSQDFDLDVLNTNDAPTLEIPTADTTGKVGEAFLLELPDGMFADDDLDSDDSLTITVTDLPDGVAYVDGAISGTPTTAGTYTVTVTATDGDLEVATDSFEIVVEGLENAAPTVDQVIAAQQIDEDAALSFTVPSDAFADDAGAENLILTATLADGSDLPAWLTFDGTTFTGTPLDADVAALSVRVTATDGEGLSVSQDFDLTVNNTNDAPTLEIPTDDTTGTVGEAFSLTLPEDMFADDDHDSGDSLSIEVTDLPDGVAYSDGVISGTPTTPGTYTVTVTATDQAFEVATDSFDIVVSDGTVTPPADPVRIQGEDADTMTGYQVQNNNASDGNALIYVPLGQSAGTATFNIGEQLAPGTYRMAIAYFDENDGESTLDISVTGDSGTTTASLVMDDDATSGNAAQASSLRTKVLTTVTVDANSVLTLNGTRDQAEHVRVDYFEFTPLAPVVDPENEAPEAPFGLQDQSVIERDAFEYDVASEFYDPEEDPMTFEVSGPEWLTITDGVLSGTPEAGDIGTFTVTVTASDGNSTTVETFDITVEDKNDAPETTGIPRQAVSVGSAVSLDVNAYFSDQDVGDVLEFRVEGGLPAGLTFENGVFSGSPLAAGSVPVTVIASDGEFEVSSTFIFDVLGEQRETIRIEAEDMDLAPQGFFTRQTSDGPEIIQMLRNRDGEATIDLGANFDARGSYDVRVAFYDENDGVSSASLAYQTGGEEFVTFAEWEFDQDGGGNGAQIQNRRTLTFNGLEIGDDTVLRLQASSKEFEHARFDYIELIPAAGEVNLAPAASPIDNIEQAIAGPIELDLMAIGAFNDPEEDALTYSLISGPAWLTMENGVLTGTPTEAGTFQVTVGATDGPANSGVIVPNTFTITVDAVPVNAAPTVALTPVLTELSELADVTAAIKVADITVTDDLDGTNVLTLSGANADLFEIVGEELFLKANAALDFETLAELNVTVEVDDATVGNTPDATADLVLAITDGNEAPTVALTPIVTSLAEDADTSLGIRVADIVITDDALGTSVLALDGADAASFEIIGDGLFLKADAALDYETQTALDVTVTVDDDTVGATPDASADFQLAVTDVDDGEVDPYAPQGDLDDDDTINSADSDIDGDGIDNVDDAFAWDAQNGQVLLDGQSIHLEFDTDGTPYQNGLTGLLQSPDAGYNEEVAENASVSDGALRVLTSNGDNGGANSGQNNFMVGIKRDDDFTVETRIANPFKDAAPTNYQQIGLALGLDQDNFLKLVYGSGANTFELTKDIGGSEGKVSTGLPGGVAFADIDELVLNISVEIEGGVSTANGTVTLIGATGQIGDPIELGPQTLDGDLGTALADPAATVGVGVTQSHYNNKPQFEATYEYLHVDAGGVAVVDEQAPTATFEIVNPEDANSDLTILVTFADASGIDAATLGAEDLILVAAGFETGSQATLVGFDAGTGVAEFSFAAPNGGWSESTTFAVRIPDGAVADASPAANAIAETTSNGFTIDIGATNEDPFAPDGDLDNDDIANSVDTDIDGDGIDNINDHFAWDAENGTLLETGASIELNFDTDGTVYQNGFTGLLQGGTPGSSALANFDEETGTATVSGGKLNVTASNGDTGGTNNPDDDYQLGIKNSDFTVEARVDNPFLSSGAANFDQVGIHVGVDSTDFAKLVFGFTGETFEFSSRTNDAEDKLGGALPVGLDGFSAVDLKMVVQAGSASSASLQGFATFLDAGGNPIAGATNVSFGTLNVTGALAAAIFDTDTGVGAGFTQTQYSGVDAPFQTAMDSFKVTANGGSAPVDPTGALEAFEGESDLKTDATYGGNAVGSAVLEIMTGESNVQSSNYGNNSFEVTNTGDKKISAIFIDVSGALYQDSVFDPDGKGGDNAAKPWAVNSDGNTGAYVSGSGYYLPGQAPIAGSLPSNGGFKGAMVKFSDSSDGGFQNGETVGFSGDMDPNSIAGLAKNGTDGVDTGATQGWDVGGISGHELIGSLFTVLFDDGTTASGQLGSDKSNAGSHALATQAPAGNDVSIAVNGTAQGSIGTYGQTLPTVIVTGEPGDTVRITMSRGFDPVTNTSSGIDGLVESRLARYDFKANNAFDEQSVDVVIGANGTFDASSMFNYGSANGTGKGSFDGDTTAPIAFVASVIEPGSGLPVGAVTSPVYLTNVGGPVEGGGGHTPVDGYYQIINSGASNARFKVQFEDENGPGGQNPGGNWSFLDSADGDGNQNGFQGDGYYLWGDEDSESLNNPQANSFLEYTIYIPEGDEGNYTMRVRASRDPGGAGDQQNDVWLKIDDDAEALQTNQSPTVSNSGFVKVYGTGTSNWGFGQNLDGEPDPNFQATFTLDAGVHTITFAGRSQGYHLDYWELMKGTGQGINAANSTFVEGDPTDGGDNGGGGGEPTPGTIVSSIAAGSDDREEFGGIGSSDIELGLNGPNEQYADLRFTGITLSDTADIESAYFEFNAFEDSSGSANFVIQIEDTLDNPTFTNGDGNSRSYLNEEVEWNNVEQWTENQNYQSADISTLIEALIEDGGIDALDALSFRITGSGGRAAHAFNSDGEAAKLIINYDDFG